MNHIMHPSKRMVLSVIVTMLVAAGGRAAPVYNEDRDREEDRSPVYDIPLMENVAIDGKADDWGGRGFRVELLAPVGAPIKSTADHDARFRLGWNKEGLLVLVSVRDNVWLEHEDPGWLWKYDGVELFLAPQRNAEDLCQWIVSPGMTAEQKELRTQFCEFRKDETLKKLPTAIEVARTKTQDGCLIEVLLPWDSLAIDPKTGREVGFQLWANDLDSKEEEDRRRAAWYPGDATQFHHDQMYSVRLSEEASPAVEVLTRVEYVWPLRHELSISAPADKQGALLEVLGKDRTLATQRLALIGGHARADITLPVGAFELTLSELRIQVDGKMVGRIALPEIVQNELFLRLFDGKEQEPLYPENIAASIAGYPGDNQGSLVVDTDAREQSWGRKVPVLVEAVAQGGQILARREATAGEEVALDTADWPDGPYEIRVSADAPDGRVKFKHLRWYKGDWKKQVAEIDAACKKLPQRPRDADSLVLQVIGAMVQDHLAPLGLSPGQSPGAANSGWGYWRAKTFERAIEDRIHPLLLEHRELQAGTRERAHGFMHLAWRDDVDDSPQYAMMALPPEYDAEKKWPLVVDLHGYNPPNPPYHQVFADIQRHSRLVERHGYIHLSPFGRGNTSYRGIGEADVLRAIEQARKTVSVDDERVHLMGGSMGGAGTIYLGTRHPGLFASIAPLVGAGDDYRVWLDEAEVLGLLPHERFRREARSTYAQAESLLATPVFVAVGLQDRFGVFGSSRYFVNMLQLWGYNVRYSETADKGHESLGNEDVVLEWLLGFRLDRNPRHVRVRSAHLRSAKAHWVRVMQMRNPFTFVHANAEVIDRATIRLDTGNVLALRLSPGEKLVDRNGEVQVIWNGADTGTHRFDGGAITLRAESYEPADLEKTPSVEGPIWHATTKPFAIVEGTTAKDQKMRRFCRRAAERRRDGWREWQNVRPRYFLDTDISDEQIRKYSLILVGGPDENLVTKKFADNLPLAIESDGIAIDGHRVEGEDLGVTMVYPHPLSQERYVVVAAGNSPAGQLSASGEEWDFVISDARGELVHGLFDRNWRLRPECVKKADTKRRAERLPRVVPKHLDTAVKGRSLPLSEVLETAGSGGSKDPARNTGPEGKPIVLGGKEYAHGISGRIWRAHESSLVFDLAGAGWQRFKSTIGIQLRKPDEVNEEQKEGTRVYFVVLGDGKELYRSPIFFWNSAPIAIDVPIEGVKSLVLRSGNEREWGYELSGVHWADARVER